MTASRVFQELRRKAVKAAALLRTPRFRRGLRRGAAAAIEHAPLLAGLIDSGLRTVVDVGANKGQFALLALELFPAAAVHAFEPLTAPGARMAAWGRDEPRLRLYPLALAETAGPRTMHISARMDNSSLRVISERQTAQFPGTHRVGVTTVETARLDEILAAADLPPPALLKIDVQGGELEVLYGAAGVLRLFDWVYVECSFVEFYEGQGSVDDIVACLADAGFSPLVYWNLCRDSRGRPVQADVLFARTGAGETQDAPA
jgi:FkbM family methyltransferase